MSSIDYSKFRKRMIEAACRGKIEDTTRLTSDLESEIILRINDLVGGFWRVEALALVAALDRYKSIVMDVVVQSGESRPPLTECGRSAERIDLHHIYQHEKEGGGEPR